MDSVPNTPKNRLLASLPPADLRCLEQNLEAVELSYKRSLYQANHIEDVYFLRLALDRSCIPCEMAQPRKSEPSAVKGLWAFFFCLAMTALPIEPAPSLRQQQLKRHGWAMSKWQ
jgi:hypothetical protein